jgi:3-methylcrotonyl-CoA carboxylase alpha subunit
VFDRILIANRGEIACRVIDTARRMGVRTVAVFSDADANARHVRLADEAYPIGPSPAMESYLRGDVIIDVAKHSGADAVHPGYGFLSENASFAEGCAAAGVTFVGPTPDAILAMGAKDKAKAIMEEAGVPVVPGYHGDSIDLKILTSEARLVGYPVLVKAVAGGGGRGMRVVPRELDLAETIASARREAKSAFGDERVLIEKMIAHPRHIEVQVFADKHGNIVHLFERDCSIQRRHQKVIEEAPSRVIAPDLREELGACAAAAAEAIDYVGAGTVEFIVDRSGNYYFMEMNTRLQVEHPVTEMITGLDLVEWQLRVAAGEKLPLAQEQISMSGHAIEARLYAEDPERDFMPSTGRLVHYRSPVEPGADKPGSRVPVRVDSGVSEGDEVSAYYDPMLAKIVVWDQDRAGALRQLGQALSEVEVVGTDTNVGLLSAITAHPSFVGNDFDTGFIERHWDALVPAPTPAPAISVALGVLYLLLRRQSQADASAAAGTDPFSPWAAPNGWRLNDDAPEIISLIDNGTPVPVEIRYRADAIALTVPDGEIEVSGSLDTDGRLNAIVGGIAISARVVWREHERGGVLHVITPDLRRQLIVENALAPVDHADTEGGRLTAPMPGRITQILTEDGTDVTRGTALLILEAMKMEHTIAAPSDGTVERMKFAVGDWVGEGETLLDFAAAE